MILQHPPWKVCAAERRNMPSIDSSRENWKRKAIERRRLNRNLTRRLVRSDSGKAELTVENIRLREELEIANEALRLQRLPKLMPSEVATMIVSVLLVIEARVSFRSIPRILSSMGFQGWIPHFSSAINWVSRVGLASLKYVRAPQEDWIAIIDMTLDIAFKKALVVLRLPLSVHLKRQG